MAQSKPAASVSSPSLDPPAAPDDADSETPGGIIAPAPTSQAARPPSATGAEAVRERFQPRFRSQLPLHPALRAFAPYAAVAIFTVALLWPLCIGRCLYWGDILLYFEPMLRLGQGAIRQGRLPLWNPYSLGGQPYVGNPQMSVFYPTTPFLAWLPAWVFLSLSSGLHLFLCGAFAYLYLRRWTVRSLPALAGAFVFEGGACLMGRLQFPPMVQAAGYFPLVLWGVDACLDRPGRKAWLGLALSVGLIVLAAHAQIAYLSLAGAACYGLMRLARMARGGDRRERARLGRQIVWPVLSAVAVGLLLTGAQTLPALQLLLESPRERLTALQANRFVLDPPQLLTLIAPRFFGHPASGDYWGGGNAWEPALFVGWLPLLLIGYAVLRCAREALVRFWAILGLAALWLATGTAGGLFWLAFLLVPGLSNFHDPARFLFLTAFAFAVLTAVGLDALAMRARRYRAGALPLALAAIVLPLWFYAWDWNPTTEAGAIAPQVSRALQKTKLLPELAGGVGGRAYLPQHDLYSQQFIQQGYADFGDPNPRHLRAFLDTLLPNLNLRGGIEAASAYEPVPVAAPSALDGLARLALRRHEPNATRLMALMNARILLLPRTSGMVDPGLEPVLNVGSVRGWRNRDAGPRAWLTRRTRRIEGKMRIVAALADESFDPAQVAIVSAGNRPFSALEARLEAQMEWRANAVNLEAPAPVALSAQSDIEKTLRVDCGKSAAFLVVSMTAYPGWRADVDGRAETLRRADGGLLGVALEPGAHRVVLRYAPDAHRVGLFLSLAACGLLSAALTVSFVQAVRFRKARPSAQHSRSRLQKPLRKV